MRLRDYLLLASCLLGLCAVVLTLALVGTPEVTGWAATAARAALGSSTVGLMLAGAAVLFLGSLAARAWAIADEAARAARTRAEVAARGYTVLPSGRDTSSLIDDSRGPLPDTFRAPCGELVRPGYGKGLLWTPTPGRDETKALFPGSPATHDSGHIAPRDAA